MNEALMLKQPNIEMGLAERDDIERVILIRTKLIYSFLCACY